VPAANHRQAPLAIYEVHLGSWRRKPEEGNRWLNWDELADTLVPYAADMGFTHLELLPISEHPFDGSWGYQPIGLYAPTARFGGPAGLRRFVQRAHDAGLGVILDWVPAHFPSDEHGLARFDGSHLYEYADPREGFHQDWNTLIYNFGRTEVRNFLVGNALYWIERFGVDGLRVDAVASMLYRDYSRAAGEWVPNVHGGRENLEAIAFLKRANEVVGGECPQAITLAEESTSFPACRAHLCRRPGLPLQVEHGLDARHAAAPEARPRAPPLAPGRDQLRPRLRLQRELRAAAVARRGGARQGVDAGQDAGRPLAALANLRAYYGFMFGHPGKKLLFMGGEFAQEREWNHDASLDWHLLHDPAHAGVQRLVRDLNHLYTRHPALHALDCEAEGFEWVRHDDRACIVTAFVRRGPGARRPCWWCATSRPRCTTACAWACRGPAPGSSG
jgi:1,4-alpha-glucan branching enzyme